MFGLSDSQTNNDPNSILPNPVAPPDSSAAPAIIHDPAATPEAPSVLSDSPAPPPADPAASPPGDLLDLKQHALQSLQPLVSHLDQTPEEKFKTTMMLIQATDNPSLVNEAYETANKIPDEKARAQALLDVVNEINYFTQRNNEAKPAA